MLYKILLPTVWLLTKILYRIRVVGAERLSSAEGSGFIICGNHQHIFDPIFIAVQRMFRPRLLVIGKAELFKNFFTNWLFRQVGAVPVERGKGDKGVIDVMQSELLKGRPLLLFPEGTRSKTGKMLPLKSGAVLISNTTGCPILPCRIIFPGGKLWLFGRVTLIFGELIYPDELNIDIQHKATIRAAKALLAQRIQSLGEENK